MSLHTVNQVIKVYHQAAGGYATHTGHLVVTLLLTCLFTGDNRKMVSWISAPMIYPSVPVTLRWTWQTSNFAAW
jgi:hypothetical protein